MPRTTPDRAWQCSASHRRPRAAAQRAQAAPRRRRAQRSLPEPPPSQQPRRQLAPRPPKQRRGGACVGAPARAAGRRPGLSEASRSFRSTGSNASALSSPAAATAPALAASYALSSGWCAAKWPASKELAARSASAAVRPPPASPDPLACAASRCGSLQRSSGAGPLWWRQGSVARARVAWGPLASMPRPSVTGRTCRPPRSKVSTAGAPRVLWPCAAGGSVTSSDAYAAAPAHHHHDDLDCFGADKRGVGHTVAAATRRQTGALVTDTGVIVTSH